MRPTLATTALAATLLVATLPGCPSTPPSDDDESGLGETTPSGGADPGEGTEDWRLEFPPHWWAPVEDADAPDWEILPQAAGVGEVILSKRNELGVLSNFTEAPFTFRGERYASLEGFWQAMKYPEGDDDPRASGEDVTWEHTRDEVAAMVAFEAHSAGVAAEKNMKALGIDWVSFEGERLRFKTDPADIDRHYELIVGASWAKMRQNPEVKKVLLGTGDLVLKPDHHEDTDGTKSWRYYDIWMSIREAVRKGEDGPPSD